MPAGSNETLNILQSVQFWAEYTGQPTNKLGSLLLDDICKAGQTQRLTIQIQVRCLGHSFNCSCARLMGMAMEQRAF